MSSFETLYASLIKKKDNILHLGLIITTGTSNKASVSQQKKGPKNQKKKNLYNRKKRVPNPLIWLTLSMVIKELSQKERRLLGIVIFLSDMVM